MSFEVWSPRGKAAIAALLLTLSCSNQNALPKAGTPSIYTLEAGGEAPVQVEIDPINKGLGSNPPNSLAVTFTVDEIRRFFAPEPVPVSPELLEMLEELDCNSYAGTAPISMMLWPAKDHTVKQLIASKMKQGTYEYAANPKRVFGLMNYGGVRYSSDEPYLITDALFLPEEHPFGFAMSCGYLDIPARGGCSVSRDVSPKLHVEYSSCEGTLPYWKEMDELYMEISRRIVKSPAVIDSYRLD